jgi:hypothetical protein
MWRRQGTSIPWLTPTRALSPSHTRLWPLWVVILYGLFLYSDPPLPCHPPSCCLRLFLSQTFFHINTPTFSNLVILHTYPPMKMEQTECSETSAYKIQTQGNYPEESIQHLEHGENLKSRCYFSKQQWSVDVYNGEAVCLLWVRTNLYVFSRVNLCLRHLNLTQIRKVVNRGTVWGSIQWDKLPKTLSFGWAFEKCSLILRCIDA